MRTKAPEHEGTISCGTIERGSGAMLPRRCGRGAARRACVVVFVRASTVSTRRHASRRETAPMGGENAGNPVFSIAAEWIIENAATSTDKPPSSSGGDERWQQLQLFDRRRDIDSKIQI